MKLLAWLLLVIVMAIAIPLAIGHGNGYVLLVQPPYRIELSTSLFLLLIVLIFLAAHALLHLTTYTLRLPERVRNYKQEKRKKEASEALMTALNALVEGRYNKAEKEAAQAIGLGAQPLLSSLAAARAAHRLKKFDLRDYYLAEAERLAPESEVARLLAQAEMLLDQRRYQDVLTVLGHLEKRDARHVPAMQLELKARRSLADWEGTLTLIGRLERRGGIDPVPAQQWKLQAYLELLKRSARDASLLRVYWNKVPENDQLDPRIALTAAHQFVAAGDGDAATTIVEKSLTRQWDGALAEFYGECVGRDPSRQFKQAESWLREHHDDAGLLLSLGRLCARQELWGKAQNYFEASLSIRVTSTAHYELARILEKLGHPLAAAEHYRSSLECKRVECR